MSHPLFVSQQLLETWLERGEVTFNDGVLTILAQKQSYVLEPAVRILSLLDGNDRDGWIGKTLTTLALAEAGAEHLRDSVIKGDTAYQCEEGYLGDSTQGSAARAPGTAQAPGAAAPKPAVPRPPTTGAVSARSTAPAPVAPPAAAPLTSPANKPTAKAPLPPPPSPKLVEAAQKKGDGEANKTTEQQDLETLTDFLLKNM